MTKTVSELFPTLRENSSSETNKRLYAVLTAVTDLIRFNKAPINATSYFAIILKTISENKHKQNQTHDLLKLFSLILSQVSVPIIKNQSVSVIIQMINVLEKYVTTETGLHAGMSNEEQSLVKSATSILGYILVLAESNQWSTPEYLRGYSYILKLSVNNTQSKIRQKAAEQVILVLNSIGAIQSRGTGSSITTNSGGIHKQLANVTSQFSHEIFTNVTQDTMGTAFYALNIVTEALCLLSPSLISLLLEDIIKLTSLSNSSLTIACYKAIGSLFFKTNPLVGSNIQQLIEVLFQYPPSGIDFKSTVSYTELLTQSYLYFIKLDPKLCNQHIHKYFTILMNNFGSDKAEITNCTMNGFKQVIYECINAEVVQQGVYSFKQNQINNSTLSPLESIILTIESGLRLTFKSSWDLILLIISSLFEQLGPNAYPLMNTTLLGLDKLYHSPEFHFQTHCRSVFIQVLASIGPKNFLSLLPLNLDSHPNNKEKINRNWLLPLMRDNIKYTELSFFIEYFYPMALAMKERSRQSEIEGKFVEAKNLEILYSQIWDLLPGFLNHPLDSDVSFKVIARNLGVSLSDEPGLRIVICAALTQMINKLKDTQITKPSPYIPYRKQHNLVTQERATVLLKSISVFAKNYLPILFNIFPTSNQDQRYFILNAIEALVSITDTVNLNLIFNSLITKLVEALTLEGIEKKDSITQSVPMVPGVGKEKTKKYYLTDLTIGFVKHLDEENIKVLYKIIKPQLKCSDPGLQKRSYKILVKICEYHENFILLNIQKIKALLVSNLMQSPSNIKKTRLKCLREIIISLTKSSYSKHISNDEELEALANDDGISGVEGVKQQPKVKVNIGWTQLKNKFIPSLIPEIILCTKETNVKCREIANEMVIEIGKVMCLIAAKLVQQKRGVSLEETVAIAHNEAIHEYLQLMMAGLASITPHMVSASIVSIARVIHEFYRDISEEFVGQLVSTVLVLLASPNREVVKAVFGLVRVVIATFKDTKSIESQLDVLINGLAKWGGIDKNYFRTIVQILLERLIKRFGFDQVYQLVPEDFKKVVTNIRKKNEKKEKAKELVRNGGAAGQDEEGDEKKSQKSRKNRKGETEDDEQMLGSNEDGSDRDHSEDDADIEEFLFNVKPKKGKKDTTNNFLIKEGDDPIDFLDRNAFSHLSAKAAADLVAKQIFAKAAKNGGKIQNPFEIDEDGRMVIESSDDENDGKRKRERKKTFLDQVFEENEEAYEKKAGYHVTKAKGLKNKFKQDNQDNSDYSDDDDDHLSRYNDDLKSSFSRKTGKTGAYKGGAGGKSVMGGNKSVKSTRTTTVRPTNDGRIETAALRYNRVRGVDHLVNYQERDNKSTKTVAKTKGDNRKRDQKFEPYSYIKLDPKALNKRKGSKPTNFNSVMKKKGSGKK